jgi:hypothetical protein
MKLFITIILILICLIIMEGCGGGGPSQVPPSSSSSSSPSSPSSSPPAPSSPTPTPTPAQLQKYIIQISTPVHPIGPARGLCVGCPQLRTDFTGDQIMLGFFSAFRSVDAHEFPLWTDFALTGQTSAQALAGFAASCTQANPKPQVCFLLVGTQDILNSDSQDDTEAAVQSVIQNLAGMINEAAAAGIPVIVADLPPSGVDPTVDTTGPVGTTADQEIDEVDSWIMTQLPRQGGGGSAGGGVTPPISADAEITVVDFYSALSGCSAGTECAYLEGFSTDGVLPTALAYNLMLTITALAVREQAVWTQ